MRKTLVVLVVLVLVAIALAGGAAFIMQQNKLGELKRLASQAEEKVEQKKYDEAITTLKRIEKEGGTARSAYLLGRSNYELGKFGDAMVHFKKIENKYPDTEYMPDALLYQARHGLEVEGKTKSAKEIFLRILEKHPDTTAADFALYYLSRISYDSGDVQQAKKNLDQLMKRADSPAKTQAEFLLGDINMKQLKSPEPGPNDEIYTIKKGDSPWKLSREMKVPMDIIVGINNLDPTKMTIGQQIKIPRMNVTIVVNKPDRTLTLMNNGAFFKKYRVGINRTDGAVPAGEYAIKSKHEKGYEFSDPETNTTIKAGDPANPLGTRFLELRRDMGIHGTNAADAIGQYIAKGYIAMTNPDVEELYSVVQNGTPVSIKGKNLLEEASE